MKMLFKFQEVSDVVENRCQALGSSSTEVQKAMVKKKDNKALFILHQYVDDVHFEKIQNATTAKEARGHFGSKS